MIEPQPYKDKVTQAEANVESSKSKLAYTKASYERMQEAVKTKAISEIDYLQAQSDYGEALAAYEEARSQLSLANIDLSYCIVKAPFTGRISRNMVDPGNMVGTDASNSALATIYKDNQMYLYFNMAYPDFARLPKNTPSALPVTIQDVNNPEKTWIAALDYSSPNIDLNTGTLNLRAIARNPNGELLSGMYVKVIVPYKSVPKAIVIPESSLGTNQGGRYVYLVGPNDTIVFRQVEVGVLTPDGMREITSGLTLEDRYVTKALINVRPGMK
ncbi:MAG: efflux RND transporter periplasmic adaptor subunit, partial [Butyricimonas faecihominis]